MGKEETEIQNAIRVAHCHEGAARLWKRSGLTGMDKRRVKNIQVRKRICRNGKA